MPDTTLHAGYARYFNPPPFELVATETVSKFQNTTGASTLTTDTTPFAERQNYFDIGGQQRLLDRRLTLGLDVFYRKSHDLIDEGQFGAPIILTPFNYASGLIFGQEFTANYTQGPLTAYFNFTHERAQGKDITSSQFSFDPGDLAYIAKNYIYLDHDQTYTGSFGASYLIRDGVIGGTRLGFDGLYGSGLRRDQDLAGRLQRAERRACAELSHLQPHRRPPLRPALRRPRRRALRRDQRRQQDLRDPRRHRGRRRRAPVRRGEGLLRRDHQIVLGWAMPPGVILAAGFGCAAACATLLGGALAIRLQRSLDALLSLGERGGAGRGAARPPPGSAGP